jgi:hypothetical protein
VPVEPEVESSGRVDRVRSRRDDPRTRFNAPIATVSIVDKDRIWFKATHGLDGVSQIEPEPGLCASAVGHDGPSVR